MTLEEKLQDIKDHPENHRHSWAELQACCMTGDAFNGGLMVAHEGLVKNEGVPLRCDVNEGPCSCGGWHLRDPR